MKKRILSFLLALLMVVGMIPTPSYAADSTEATTEPTVPKTTVETVNDVVAAPAALDFTTADYIADIGKFAKLNTDDIFFVLEEEPTGLWNPALYYPEDVSADTLFEIINVKVLEESFDLTDEETGEVIGQKKEYTLWYQVEVLSGTVSEDFKDGYWILQNYLNEEDAYDTNALVLSDPADHTWCDTCNKYDCGIDHDASEPSEPEEEAVTKTETTSSGTTVGVQGVLPKGTQLSVSDATVNAIEFGIEDPDSVLAAVDIKLLSADDTEYQPYEHERNVKVTLDAAAMGLQNGDVVRLHHKHGSTISTDEVVLVVNGKITFFANQFSIYVVEDTTQTSGNLLVSGSTVTMTVGEKKIFYSPGLDRTSYGGTIDDSYNYYRYYVWSAADTYNAINYTVHNTDAGYNENYLIGSYDPRVAPWITVEAKKSGTATITIQTTLGRQDLQENPFYVLGSESLTINVVEKENFHIENDIPKSGCLKAVGLDGIPGVTYAWTRNDNKAVRPEALVQAGINVSIDHGGVVDGENPITYTVTAYDVNGNSLGTDSYTILYGSEILNPSFEEPSHISDSWHPGWGQEGYGYATNGTPGLYWKTTAPGTGNHLGHDIEFGKSGSPHNANPADGYQFVELNAEGYGALYQDILTTPGATLSWEFSHAKRDNYTSRMYIVMAESLYACNIIDYDDIKALVKSATDTNKPIPNSGEGMEFMHEGGTYRIWYNEANETAKWEQISGSYIVPEDQYLTRLFFVSDPNSGNNTFSNLIDAVIAGEKMSYIVEYYKDATVQSGDTETGSDLRPNTSVDLKNLQEYLDDYEYPAAILVNGRSYPGTLADLKNGLYITDYGEKPDSLSGYSQDIVVQIYFQVPNIIVTKIVDIVGMSAGDKNQILNNGGFSANFQLINNENADDKFTAGATITQYSASGELKAESSFKDSEGKYVTAEDYGKQFTVSETSATEIENYKLITTIKTGYDRNNLQERDQVAVYEDKAGSTEDDNKDVAYVEVTNTYYPMGDLRVSKFVQSNFPGIEINDSQKTQKFTFTVTLSGMTDQIPASLRGSYNYTIKEYADGAVPSAQDMQVSTGESTLSENNMLTFTLKHNQYIVIEDLPAGAYTITETPPSGYQQPNFIYENDNAVIPVGDTADVKCYNTPEITVGDLKLTKNVVDNSANKNAPMPDEGFVFTVMLNGAYNPITEGTPFKVTYSCDAKKGTLSGDQSTYQLEKNGIIYTYNLTQTVTPVFTADDSYTFHISLYDGLTATIEDLPPCSYSVQEDDYSALKYGTTYTGDNGTLGGTNNAVSEMVCTNTYPLKTGNLKITKTVQKEYDPDPMGAATFTFTIKPVADSTVDLETSYAVKVGSGALQNVDVIDGKLTVTIPFTAAEMANVSKAQPAVKELMVYDLPMGQYTVTEGVVSGYDQMDPNQTVTIAAEPEEAGFLNIFKRITGTITIKKTVEGTTEADTFLFHLKGTDEHTNHIDMDVTITGSSSVMIQDLPIGNYTVTEDTSWNWRYTSNPTSGSATATLTADAPPVEVDFTNTLTNNNWLNFVTTMKNTFKH